MLCAYTMPPETGLGGRCRLCAAVCAQAGLAQGILDCLAKAPYIGEELMRESDSSACGDGE